MKHFFRIGISFLLSWFLLASFFWATLGQSEAQSRIGVGVGDWVKYNISFDGYVGWKTEDDKERDWVKVEIQEISNDYVTLHETTHFRNGTDEVVAITRGVETGWAGAYLIAANLSDGDKIFVEGIELGDPPFHINYTTSRDYGVSRQANVLSLTVVTRLALHPMNITEEAYWDKATGFLLEHKQEAFIPQYENATRGVWLMRIAETNLWEMPADARPYWSQWLPVITMGMITAAVVSSALVERRRKNKGEAREK